MSLGILIRILALIRFASALIYQLRFSKDVFTITLVPNVLNIFTDAFYLIMSFVKIKVAHK